MEIKSLSFDVNGLNELSSISKGKNWPVIYLIHNENELYIGETTSASTRMKQHLNNPKKQHLKKINFVFDDTYNKSVILDFEQKLIKCCEADSKFEKILNMNKGQSAAHDYYDRNSYSNVFNSLWSKLIAENLATNSLDIIQNTNIYKYSPYTALTEEQDEISSDIINDIVDKLEECTKGVSVVDGCAGTGKTILAINIIHAIVNAVNLDESDIAFEKLGSKKIKALSRLKKFIMMNDQLKIGFVFPMQGIRSTIEDVFRSCSDGLTGDMVLRPSQVLDEKFDILFVDESHRLSKRKNIVNYDSFDKMCAKLNLNKYTSNQLDWVLLSSKYTVLFYDKDQSIKGSDISFDEYNATLNKYVHDINYYRLSTQMRCAGGDTYISYIKSILNCSQSNFKQIMNYDFKIFDDVDKMINKIRKFDEQLSLCKTVAGFSWKWVTKQKGKIKDDMETFNKLVSAGLYDITIGEYKYLWNLVDSGWISREDSRYTIGCIHTTQGYDLNYVGVIFGEEIDYNPETNQIEINLDKFYDSNVKKSNTIEVVKNYILNTYATIMSRGIKGCYVYVCNENLREYLKKFIKKGI